jgi:3-dehydroquinate dehydratase
MPFDFFLNVDLVNPEAVGDAVRVSGFGVDSYVLGLEAAINIAKRK